MKKVVDKVANNEPGQEQDKKQVIPREKAGRFKKGVSGNPTGRAEGTINRKTAIVRDFTDHMIAGGSEKFQRELNKLKGRDYVTEYLTLLEYSLPKKDRVEHSGADGEAIKVQQVFRINETDIVL